MGHDWIYRRLPDPNQKPAIILSLDFLALELFIMLELSSFHDIFHPHLYIILYDSDIWVPRRYAYTRRITDYEYTWSSDLQAVQQKHRRW